MEITLFIFTNSLLASIALKFLDENLGNLVTFLLRKAFEEYV
jgi:hypothetical protein